MEEQCPQRLITVQTCQKGQAAEGALIIFLVCLRSQQLSGLLLQRWNISRPKSLFLPSFSLYFRGMQQGPEREGVSLQTEPQSLTFLPL